MRKKSLIVGADCPFVGPQVYLEEGEWLVEPPSEGEVSLRIGDISSDDVYMNGEGIRVTGPCWVSGRVLEGKKVYLQARMI